MPSKRDVLLFLIYAVVVILCLLGWVVIPLIGALKGVGV